VVLGSAASPGGPGWGSQVSGALHAFGSEQTIRFLRCGGRQVAYAVVGRGAPLLLDLGRAHDLEAFWRHPPYRRFVQRLGEHFTVVRWDRPGFGLSDRAPPDLSIDAEVAILEELTRLLRLEGVAAFAAHDAGPVIVWFGARHPERLSRLALFGTASDGRVLTPPLPAAVLDAMCESGSPAIHKVVAATAASGCQPEVAGWLGEALATAAGAATEGRLLAETRRLDATAALPRLAMPVRVVHRTGDRLVPPARARAMAAGIPGAELVSLAGTEHLPYEGDLERLLGAVVPFLAGGEEAGRAARRASLSPREQEVVRMVTRGLTSAQIGRRLAIRTRTVEAHLEHVRLKLGVHSRAQIAAWAVAGHLLEVGQRPAS
jgi:pimeloyl-ACP methyl ester carboxylesterase/DNA-binding CsgD family transcriptional regulator